jgi:hypothetical protein
VFVGLKSSGATGEGRSPLASASTPTNMFGAARMSVSSYTSNVRQSLYTELASRDAVAKLRLDGTPTPRSWVARMTKRPVPTGAGKSASELRRPEQGSDDDRRHQAER